MKPRVLVPVLLLCLLSLVLDASGQNFQRKVFSLDFSGVEANTAITNSIIVPAGETWELVQMYGTSRPDFVEIKIQVDGQTVGSIAGSGGGELIPKAWGVGPTSLFILSTKYSSPIVVGPATLELVSSPEFGENTEVQVMLIYRVVSETGTNPTPSNTVVIPSDAAGPVEIILESSVDLVNWTRAEPGEYGASTEKRFFRLRAVAK